MVEWLRRVSVAAGVALPAVLALEVLLGGALLEALAEARTVKDCVAEAAAEGVVLLVALRQRESVGEAEGESKFTNGLPEAVMEGAG